jgi:hypothetical protein
MRPIYERIFRIFASAEEAGLTAELRRELVWTYSFAVPNEAALEELALHGPIVEIGAGTGYWAWRLQSQGVTVYAYDRTPGIPVWYPVSEGGADRITAHPGATLLLCWPPLDEPLASEALQRYRGERLFYIGERGDRARTGDLDFHTQLERDYELVREIPLARWPGFRDSVWIFRRK